MRITSIEINSWSSGKIMVNIDDAGTYLYINLTEEEGKRLLALGLEIFLERQPALAKQVADARILENA